MKVKKEIKNVFKNIDSVISLQKDTRDLYVINVDFFFIDYVSVVFDRNVGI